MAATSILKQIKELSRSSSQKLELRDYVSKLKYEQVEAIVQKCLSTTDGAELLQTILLNFEDSAACQGKLFKVIQICMKHTGHGNVPVQIVLMFMPKCSSDQLVKLVDLSLDLIRAGNEGSTIWKDALPECLSILSSRRGSVLHCGTEMPVSEFKSKCFISICHLRWPDEITAQIASMFVDMSMNIEEHVMVTNKICTSIANCRPESLPPLFHQLLRLCKNRNIFLPITHVDDYFKIRLYSKLKLREGNLPDSESMSYEMDEIDSTSVEELQQALSTCLYHISQSSTSRDMRRTLLKEWDKSRTLISPFLCNVLLVIANNGYDSASYLGILKSCLMQQCMFRRSSVRSAWWRTLGLEIVDTKLLVTTLVDETKVHGQLTSKALLDLGILLLSIWHREPTAEFMWAHGQTIIVKLCRCQPGALPTVLSMLVDKLVSDSAANPGKQYADALGLLSRHVPLTMCENSSAVQSLLERCLLSDRDWSMCCYVTDAVQPIARLNTRVRDTILMLCRKGMFSREKDIRRAAIAGLLGLLRRLKANQRGDSNSGSIHTINSDSHSLLTQISIDLHATQVGEGIKSNVNDSTVSIEIISILRRCLTQSGVVKEDLYIGLCRAVIDKPFLKDHVLELLLEHMGKYLAPEEPAGPFCPLLLEKCVEIKDACLTLMEPLAYLIHVIQQLLLYASPHDEDPDSVETILETGGPSLRAVAVLIRISDAMSKCHMENYALDNSVGLQDLLPESKAKAAIVKQIVQCLESLMAYRINEWSAEHSDQGSKILHLFKARQEVVDFTKTSSKGKKGQKTSPKPEKRKKQAKKEDGMKLGTMVKDRAPAFRLPPCIWDIRTALRILTLLQSDSVPWARTETTTGLRTNREFQRFASRGALSSLAALKNNQLPNKADLEEVAEMAKLIYDRCVLRFEAICSYDQQTSLHLLECFEECLSICLAGNTVSCAEKFAHIVNFSSESSIARSSDVILSSLMSCLEQTKDGDVLSIDEEEPSAKKIIAILIKCITLLIDKAPNHFFVKGCNISVDEEKFGEEALVSLDNYFSKSPAALETTLSPLLTLTNRRRQDWSLVDRVVIRIGKVVGLIDDEKEHSDDSLSADEYFPSLTEGTASTYLTALCCHLCFRCETAHRALTAIADLSHSNKVHKEACRSLFVELCRLSATITLCCSPHIPIGRASDTVLKFACDHYSLLSNVMKHLSNRVSTGGIDSFNHLLQYCRFEKLLKMSGKKMSNAVDSFISYVGTESGSSRSKVLKDTKVIPKLVFEIETFTRNIIVLEKKCKQNFQRFLSLGAARDFRIQAPVLKEALNTARDNASVENIQDVTESEETEINDNVDAPEDSDKENQKSDDNCAENTSDDDEIPPSAKKARLG